MSGFAEGAALIGGLKRLLIEWLKTPANIVINIK